MSPTTQQYIRMIRNRAKRDYALRYWSYLERDAKGIQVTEPSRGDLGYMAAQAVRFSLHDLRRHYG